jgi:hypothetical protein
MRPFEEFLYPFLERKHAQLLPEVANKKELTDELREALTKAHHRRQGGVHGRAGIKAA